MELGFLKLDAEALAQGAIVGAPAHAQHFNLTGIGLQQPFEDLDGGRLAGAVRPEQTKTLAGPHLEVEAGDRHHVTVAFVQAAAQHRGP